MEVAVSLYLGCLGTVPEKLQALANECSHIKGLRKQLVFLKDELVAMRAFLLKVAAMEQEGPLDIQLKVWAQDVRETSYDVEDCVDDFTRSLHLAGEGKKQQGSNMITDFFRKCSQTLLTLRTWHEFADTFEELKARVVDAGDRWERYKLDGTLLLSTTCGPCAPGMLFSFPENNCSSRIITTTRVISVAHSCCSSLDGRVYEMEPLTFQQSKWLFLKRLFGCEECPDQLQEVSDEIVKKCGGLPLAVINISGLLTTQPAVKADWEVIRDSIGSALEKNRDLEGLNSILMLSYVALPQNLRTCVLYLSMFPEDCEINRDRLVRMWIAENFIAEERGRTLQEVAEGYFYELINRSLVQATDIGYDGKPQSFKVHDLMLDLLISKASEENFVTIVGQGSVHSPQDNIRRLSIQQPEQDATSGLQGRVSHVRSLSCFGQVRSLPVLEEFRCLHVLDLEGLSVLNSFDLSKIENLTRLKYLSLRDAFISEVPLGIAKLHDLETLDVRGTNITELPAGIVCLRKLRQLLTGNVDQGLTKIPDGIGNMESLQVVVGFNIMRSSIDAIEDLGYLINLKELSIQFNTGGYDQTSRYEEVLFSSLCKLGNSLQSLWILSVDSSSLQFLESWYPLPVFLQRFRMSTNFYYLKTPNWFLPELKSLYFISINISEVTEEELYILSKLCALTFLDLWFKVDPKQKITFPRGGFKSLKRFNFVRDPYVVRGMGYIVFEDGVLPKLEGLSIPLSVSMAKGYDFYVGIVHLRSLTHAKVILGKDGATPSEVKAAAESIEKEVSANPNNPKVSIEESQRPGDNSEE
ncbi:hypothetical protein HU200_022262 [Digitaria exilis]|uniref:Uncharacterized protein n=1 Tax=Digitaria exilis TaxID=1010633 RepID=A0A835K8H7_9POAL|nr:hypothetical protein HU200_022262 [Digitaria exilis]